MDRRTLESDVNRGYGVVNRGSCVNIVIGYVYTLAPSIV